MHSAFPTTGAVCAGVRSYVMAQHELRKTCIHEAAHTVAAKVNGFPVPWVSVDPNFIRHDKIAIVTGVSDHSAICMAIVSQRLGPILQQGGPRTVGERDTVFRYGVQVMAGPYAEQRFDPETYDPAMAGGDVFQLKGILLEIEPNAAKRAMLLSRIQKAATAFVYEHRKPIADVAVRLEQAKTLMEEEIDMILGQAMQEAA